MIVTLEEVKNYLRVDSVDDDALISTLIQVAETYIKNATSQEFSSTNELAKLFCFVLISDMYDNRTMSGPSENIRPIIQNIMNQLSYSYILSPKGLQASVKDGTLTLTWIASREPSLLGYKVYKDGVEIDKTTTNSYETSYTAGLYQVKAYNEELDESELSKGVSV